MNIRTLAVILSLLFLINNTFADAEMLRTMHAEFTVAYGPGDGIYDDTLFFVIDQNLIVVDETSLNQTNQNNRLGLLLRQIGQQQCKVKYNPPNSNLSYVEICGSLVARAKNSFVMDRYERSVLKNGREQVTKMRVGASGSATTCRVELISYQRTFATTPGIFHSPVSILRQSCEVI